MGKLALVAGNGFEFVFERVADVEDEAGALDDAEMDAEVVVKLGRVEGLARHVGPAELGPESGVIDETAGSDVVGMHVFPIGGKNHLWSRLSEDAGDGVTSVDRGFELAVREAEVLPPGEAKDFGGFCGFGNALFVAAVGGGLARGEIKDADLLTRTSELDDRASRAEFGVVGMDGNDEEVEGRGRGEVGGGCRHGLIVVRLDSKVCDAIDGKRTYDTRYAEDRHDEPPSSPTQQ